MDAIEFLRLNHIPTELREKNNIYIECPQCGKKNLSIERGSGLFHCWSTGCGIKGSFPKLISILGIKGEIPDLTFKAKNTAEKKLSELEIEALFTYQLNKSEVIEWAVSRSLDPDTVLKAGVGFMKEQNAIVFPYRDAHGKLVGYKCKGIQKRMTQDGKSLYPQWTVGREPQLYCPDIKDLKKEKIILVEGETDALTLKGFGLPVAASLGTTKDKGFELLKTTRRVFIGYDMDQPGKEGAEAAAEKLGPFKCRRLEWGAKDPNDWAMAGATRDQILEALSKATRFVESASLLSAYDAVQEYFDQHEAGMKPRCSWGWPRLDSFTEGWSGGELIGIQAESNTGKTTFLINVLRNVARQGYQCGFVSLEEHPINEISPKLFSCLLGKNLKVHGCSRKEAEEVHKELENIKLYKKSCDLKEVLDFARECYYNHDVKMIAIDYFQLLVKDETNVQDLKEAIWALKNLVLECHDLCIVLVIQPKQLNEESSKTQPAKRTKLDKNSARGGSVIFQTVDKMLNVTKVPRWPNVTQYEFIKCRGHLNVDRAQWENKKTQLQYDHNSLGMEELECMKYEA